MREIDLEGEPKAEAGAKGVGATQGVEAHLSKSKAVAGSSASNPKSKAAAGSSASNPKSKAAAVANPWIIPCAVFGVIAIIAVAVGFGVGLGLSGDDDDSAPLPPLSPPASPPPPSPPPPGYLTFPTEYVSKDGELEIDLTLGPLPYTSDQVSFTGRGYNGEWPGPLLRVKAGDKITVHLHNSLSDKDNEKAKLKNDYHTPNTTNLHTHGLHVSSKDPGDNVLVEVKPGGSRTYVYELEDSHMAGNRACAHLDPRTHEQLPSLPLPLPLPPVPVPVIAQRSLNRDSLAQIGTTRTTTEALRSRSPPAPPA